MKLNRFKSFIPVAAFLLSMGFMSSCVKDLHVDNINPQQTSELDANALLNKIYSSFVLTGQVGPDGDKDIADIDEGRSDLYRKSWEMNEFPTGEASWQWDDTGLPELLNKTWGADNASSVGLYYRLFFSITLCNYYLDQVADDGTEDIKQKRAEVRFIRSLLYYYVMDFYGNAAFIEHVSQEPGIRYTRDQYYSYIEQELLAIEGDLAAAGANQYGRVDKVAAWMLLSRLYLNAGVYTGTPQWAKAKEYAEKVINNGHYHLNTTGSNGYSAYQMLFLADNDTNGAQYENIFPVLNDGIKTQSHGSMHFLVLSTYAKRDASDMDVIVPSGTDVSWGKCMAVTGQLVDAFFGKGVSAPSETISLNDITTAAGDNRALFFTTGYTRDITDRSQETQGYGCVKFRNVRSDGKPASALAKVDTDLPLMRIAEAYLTYAEAETRLNGATSAAKEKIDAIRNRANAVTYNSYSLDQIQEEWIREFWFEGRSRIDQIRFGSYDLPKYRYIYPIPNNDLTNNPNLEQNPGY
ncbi:MAG: RagB/SusD family nutrient uptake outer membrane protein [Prevotella sp.]|nr:RagB/SusD family nutrient uptake outer membrane protein [Prevotella sp.]